MNLTRLILIAFVLCAVCMTASHAAERTDDVTIVSTSPPAPDRDNPLIGFYCGRLTEHLSWCHRMHLGYSKNKKLNMIIPYKETNGNVNTRQIDTLINQIETDYSQYGIIPWLSLSLSWVTMTFGSIDDVSDFFNTNGPAIDRWFHQLSKGFNGLDTVHDLKPRRYRFESEANVYRFSGKPLIYYETTRHIYQMFQRYLPDATMVISIATAETCHAIDYLRPILEYHRETYPEMPLPFDGLQCSCHGKQYMHSVDVHNHIAALFRDVFGEKNGTDRFNRLIFWSNENSGFALGKPTTSGIVYATDQERARQDIKSVTQYLAIPGIVMVNVDRRTEGDRHPRHKNNYHNLNGLVQDGCGIFDRGAGAVSSAQASLELFTGYIHGYRPDKNETTSAVRTFDFVNRTHSSRHRLIVWREFGNAKNVEHIDIPEAWRSLESVWCINLITRVEQQVPIDRLKNVIELRIDDNPLLITPSKELEGE